VSEVETDFLLISEAVAHLEAGMFGGAIRRPEPVEAIKKICPQLSVGWGLHKEKAALAIHAAIMKGSLGVHVFTRPTAEGSCQTLRVPLDALARLLKVRGALPDHAIRPPVALLRHNFVTPELFAALSSSALFLQATEFEAWYQQQKSRRRWHSQRESIKPRTGRPTKQTDELLTSIRARVTENAWSAPDGIAKLAKLLTSIGPPLRNTLKRAVDQLYEETGDARYRIVARKRAKSKSAKPQT
jgi:hypothetical protein